MFQVTPQIYQKPSGYGYNADFSHPLASMAKPLRSAYFGVGT
jgi:hypothetical protein